MSGRGEATDSQGFTLVELLVGLSLMALISLLLFGGFRFGLRAWEVGDDRVAATDQIEMAQHLLRREFAEAQPVIVGQLVPRASTLFRGDSTGVEFVAPLPSHRSIGGFYIFSLTVREANGNRQLLLRWRRFRADRVEAIAFDPKDESVLVNGIDDIAIEYFGRLNADAPAQWLARWDGALGLPQMVRLRVAFPRGDVRRWPELVVAPRLWIVPT